MKLLFDENLSPRLVQLLDCDFPASAHVRSLGLRGAPDEVIWELARREGYIIVSKDNDFRQRSFLEGAPPKVIWLSIGNAGTEAILRLLQSQRATIQLFEGDAETSLLALTLADGLV